jgi:allantoin racemase
MKILNILPIISDIWTDEMAAYVGKYLLPDTEVVSKRLAHGPASIEGEYDEVLATPEIVFLSEEAEKEGFDGVFINCFGDPGVRAARERVNIPVFGGFEPAILYALGISDRIGIITVLPEVLSMLEGLIARQKLQERIPSLRYVDIPVLDLSGVEVLTKALIAESKRAITEDGAGVIILGCTGMVGVKETVERGLQADGYNTPVVEAAQTALMMLETFIRMGLRHSRITYMPPRKKDRLWWNGNETRRIL